jgi:uncharacterized membrane protein
VAEFFKTMAGSISLGIETAAAVLVAYGAAEALSRLIVSTVHARDLAVEHSGIWRRFGMWLLLGLEFELAADIVRTALTPTWEDIGQLAAITAIRTVLNYFLRRDLQD